MSTSQSAAPLSLRRSRLSELSAMISLFILTIRQHLHGRRLVVLAGLYLLPCALAVVLRSLPQPAPTTELEFALVFNLLPHGMAPLTALLYAAGIIRDEIEEQTLTYISIRSIPRWAIYVIKLLATMCMTIVLVAFAATALYLAIYVNTPDLWTEVLPQRLPRVIAVFALAQAAYCALFGLLGLITRRSLIGGIVYIVAIEGIVANIPFVGRALTVVYYVRSMLIHFVELPPRIQRNITREWNLSVDTMPTMDQCLTRLITFSAVAIAIAALSFARREFRVKTPGD